MDEFAARLLVFLVLPLTVAAAVIRFDPRASTRSLRCEAVLIPMFVFGAGNGFSGFIGHVFLSDDVADAIGWATGSPFQLEVGFANLALGLLAAIAAGRTDGFREATVIAGTTFAVGASIAHLRDYLDSGNTEAGNTIQNISNLGRPAILITALLLLRRAIGAGDDAAILAPAVPWRRQLINASVLSLIVASTAFGVGYTVDLVLPVTMAGVALGGAVFWATARRSTPSPVAGPDPD